MRPKKKSDEFTEIGNGEGSPFLSQLGGLRSVVSPKPFQHFLCVTERFRWEENAMVTVEVENNFELSISVFVPVAAPLTVVKVVM